MALIKNAKGRRSGQSPSGYTRVFGNEQLGNLISRVQGTVISSGRELENLIWSSVNQITNLDDFLDETRLRSTALQGKWVARKEQIKKSKQIQSAIEPDFLVFDVDEYDYYAIEVKDGDTFDTKKAKGEYDSLNKFKNDLASATAFRANIRICSFNAKTKKEVYEGLKKRFPLSMVMTGWELCEMLDISYDDLIGRRLGDQEANIDYFIDSLLSISEVREKLLHSPKAQL